MSLFRNPTKVRPLYAPLILFRLSDHQMESLSRKVRKLLKILDPSLPSPPITTKQNGRVQKTLCLIPSRVSIMLKATMAKYSILPPASQRKSFTRFPSSSFKRDTPAAKKDSFSELLSNTSMDKNGFNIMTAKLFQLDKPSRMITRRKELSFSSHSWPPRSDL